ncbi:hypothetical protein CANARDRAFT_29469 [[Candida] arabinofermentans NRRL YB-2248]|uniref:Uncharacterized protein n=1 Tax=[Candida] arabinofermentans NRRL YB-2248 TaxID=983967 RepID=A0A1E4SWY0_9ASCO|nr:hypothetical protein CANARDRAFT_29469 [[Candida] arabinofermentans NRRL YB-2248]
MPLITLNVSYNLGSCIDGVLNLSMNDLLNILFGFIVVSFIMKRIPKLGHLSSIAKPNIESL